MYIYIYIHSPQSVFNQLVVSAAVSQAGLDLMSFGFFNVAPACNHRCKICTTTQKKKGYGLDTNCAGLVRMCQKSMDPSGSHWMSANFFPVDLPNIPPAASDEHDRDGPGIHKKSCDSSTPLGDG